MEEEFSSVCKNCGSDLYFNPKSGCLTCKYCESNFYLPKKKKNAVIVRQYSAAFHPNMLNDNLNSYKCNSCGRTYFMTTEGRSSRCPACGNSSTTLVSEPGYCADGIIPFKLTKKEAATKLAEFIVNNKKLPRELVKLVKEGKLMAVYIPVWNFSFNMFGTYSATENILKKDSYNMFYSVPNPIFGDKTKRVQSLDQCATEGEDEQFLELFDESDYSQIIPYIPEYACGCRVEPVTKDIHNFYSTIIGDAEEEFEKEIKHDLLKRKNETTNISVATKARDVFFNFTYVPVYVNAFKYRKKVYKLFVSGTTGKVIGKTPVSVWSRFRNFLKVLGVGAILAGILYLFKK